MCYTNNVSLAYEGEKMNFKDTNKYTNLTITVTRIDNVLMNVPEYKFVITSPNGSLGGASFNN
jgi:hypothetical protein